MITEHEAMQQVAKAATEAFHSQVQDVAYRFPKPKLDVDGEAKLIQERVYNAILGVIETLPTATVNHVLAQLLTDSGVKEMSSILKENVKKNSKSN